MRYWVVYMLLFFSRCLLADNYALIIGIGNYPPQSGWYNISSVNDVDILCKSLPKTFSIKTLVDKQATHKNIILSFNELNNQVHAGDTLFIHFSCHGQQVIREGNQEPDYLDESLVSYDAESVRSEIYNGENHLLDDEFGHYLTLLRKSVGKGGLIVVTLDACYSDSMNKGHLAPESDSIIYRGVSVIFGSNYVSEDSLNFISAHSKERDMYDIEKSDTLSDVVLISACQSNQKNMELKIKGKGYGSLSYSVFQTFADKVNFNNITLWIDKVLGYMSENVYTQNPQLRTSLDYNVKHTPLPIKGNNQSNKSDKIPVFVIIFIFIAIIMSLIIWKKRK